MEMTHRGLAVQAWAQLAALLTVSAVGAAEPRGRLQFPADTGVINVKDAQFGAKGDGITDDTAAIQKALSAGLNRHAIVYLPAGTYLVSDTLKWRDPRNPSNGGWGRFLSIQGQGRGHTTIRLADRAPGFGDPASPKPVVMTASGDDFNNYSDANGEGNQAFENSIRDLTIDVGRGNPGAVGVDYQVSNWGAIRNVTIRSSDPAGAGYCGIRLERRDNGPGLIAGVTIEGFQYGVRASQEICTMVFEDLTLRNQKALGIFQKDAIFSARRLSSHNAVPAVRASGNAHLVLVDSFLSGGRQQACAVEFADAACGYLRGVTSSGYGGVVSNRGVPVEGRRLAHWSTDPAAGSGLPLELPARDTPDFWCADLSRWQRAGPPTGGDDAAIIQAAMDAGKPVVYLPYGDYKLGATVTVPPHVRLVIGMGGAISATEKGRFRDRPLFRIVGGAREDTTIFDRLTAYIDDDLAFEHTSPRTLVLRDCSGLGGYRASPGAGDVFIEGCVGGGSWSFCAGQRVWARQWDIEVSGNPKVRARGAAIWCLGFKSEGADTLFEISEGAALELLGGFAYTFGVPRESAAFVCVDSDVLLSFAGASYVNGFYHTIVRLTQRGQTKTFTREEARARGMACQVPLYVGRRGD